MFYCSPSKWIEKDPSNTVLHTDGQKSVDIMTSTAGWYNSLLLHGIIPHIFFLSLPKKTSNLKEVIIFETHWRIALYSDLFLLRTGNSHSRTKKYTLILLLQRSRTWNFRERVTATLLFVKGSPSTRIRFGRRHWQGGTRQRHSKKSTRLNKRAHRLLSEWGRASWQAAFSPFILSWHSSRTAQGPAPTLSRVSRLSTRQPPRGQAERETARVKRASCGRQRSGVGGEKRWAERHAATGQRGGRSGRRRCSARRSGSVRRFHYDHYFGTRGASGSRAALGRTGQGREEEPLPEQGRVAQWQAAPGGRGPSSHLQRGHGAGEEVLAVLQLLQLGRLRLPHRRGLPLRRHLSSDPAARAHVTPAPPLGTWWGSGRARWGAVAGGCPVLRGGGSAARC